MNIFELFGVIAVHNDEAHKSIDATSKKAQDLQNKMDKAFGKIGKAALSCGKAVAKGLTVVSAAGAAAVGALMKSSISAYADYEQLAGGVETLFKDSSDKVMAYANNAYKTAGLSANDYMSTVTSFSASLLQGLGGDTSAAAEMADMAITDMADNANKMGTDMSMIQNAYQGFAKQNYTMLDNLKLGYGGTQSEMARLINDSGVLGDTMVVTAETVNQVSFAKMIEAIHVIQTEMGITGTTAKEASETISGSFNTWKATWTNLLTGMADDENIDPLIDTFFEAGQTVLQNVGRVIPKITANIGKAMQRLGANIKTWMSGTVWPSIQEYAKAKFGIELPTWSEMETTVSNWWASTRTSVENFCQWTLKLFNEPGEAANEAGAAISDWWENKGKPGVLSASTWALNLFGVPIESDAQISKHVATWWETAGNLVIDACNWTLRLFGMPEANATAITTIVKKWWSGVSGLVGIACNWLLNVTGVEPWDSTDTQMVRDWWDGVCTDIESLLAWFVQSPTMPDADLTARRIMIWWDGVRKQLKLTFGITPEIQSVVNSGIKDVKDAAEDVAEAVKEATGSTFLGDLSEQIVNNSTVNPDNPMGLNFRDIWEAFTYDPGNGSDSGTNGDSGGGGTGASTTVFDPENGGNGKPGLPGFATGLDYVPYNNMLARLHYGEAVLTREDASAWRSGRAEDVSILANRLESALDRLAAIMQQVVQNTATGQNIVLDSGALVGQIAPRMDAQLGMLGSRKARRG